MAQFITGKKLADEVYDVIFNAKQHLLIVSPFIKLDNYFKEEVFNKHKTNPDLHIIIVFGKNENNPKRSFNKNDFDYFKEFPNISIVYVPTLHAKYYANESKGIVTSINLYDYSFKNNTEFGVISETKLIGGSKIDVQAWEESMNILSKNYTVYIKRPIYKKKLFGKNYLNSETLLDSTSILLEGKLPEKVDVFNFMQESIMNIGEQKERLSRDEYEKKHQKSQIPITPEPELVISEVITYSKTLLSGTALGKTKVKTLIEVKEIMAFQDFVVNDKITEKGMLNGIKYQTNGKGGSWIVYPESLGEYLK